MNWNDHLQPDESIVWQGKPAPRCYTFRNWPHSLFGLVLLVPCSVWLYVGISVEPVYQQALYSWIPLPFLLAGLYLAIGHLIVARLEWESVYYAITDRRLLLQSGVFKKSVLTLALRDITWFRLNFFSKTLGSVSLRAAGRDAKVVLACIEHPRQMTDLLEAAMAQSGSGVEGVSSASSEAL
ncbi:MAG: PH domain-containing protein [Desulfuromonadales bacterium]|nr:PH domain-containing protein [Desulfuromonadales bacterium]